MLGRSEHDLIIDADMSTPQVYEFQTAICTVISRRYPGSISANQDSALVKLTSDGVLVVAVADGMGGARDGAKASAAATGSLANTLSAPTTTGDQTRTSILDGIETANRQVRVLGSGGATTLVVAEMQHDRARLYHVGDSMALVVGQRGKVKQQTIAHSPTGFALEAGHLHEHEAIHHEDRHLVSNMVGDVDMRIEVGSPRKLAVRDTILLGSDGLFDNLLIQEIVEYIRQGPLDDAVQGLADRATSRMVAPDPGQPSKPDDLTIIACRRRT